MLWKLFLAAYSFGVSVENVVLHDNARYLAFLTNQGIWLTISYFIFSALASVVVRFTPSLSVDNHAWRLFLMVTQLLFSISLPIQLVIVTLYWLLLASPQPSSLLYWDNLESHGIKFALIWLDLLTGSMTLPPPQCIATLSASIIYAVINLSVTLSTYPVYTVLKWRDWGSLVLIVGALLYAVFAFFLGNMLSRSRDALALYLNKKEFDEAGSEDREEDVRYPSRFLDDTEKLPYIACTPTPQGLEQSLL